MRTVIFIAAVMLADAIKTTPSNSESVTSFLAIAFIIFAVADILELFKNLIRK